jgi:hypothetical protein
MRTPEQIIELARKCQHLDQPGAHSFRMTVEDLERFYQAAYHEGWRDEVVRRDSKCES